MSYDKKIILNRIYNILYQHNLIDMLKEDFIKEIALDISDGIVFDISDEDLAVEIDNYIKDYLDHNHKMFEKKMADTSLEQKAETIMLYNLYTEDIIKKVESLDISSKEKDDLTALISSLNNYCTYNSMFIKTISSVMYDKAGLTLANDIMNTAVFNVNRDVTGIIDDYEKAKKEGKSFFGVLIADNNEKHKGTDNVIPFRRKIN